MKQNQEATRPHCCIVNGKLYRFNDLPSASKFLRGNFTGKVVSEDEIVRAGNEYDALNQIAESMKLIEIITKTTVDLVAQNMLTPTEPDRQLMQLHETAKSALAKLSAVRNP